MKKGDFVVIEFTGRLENGEIFDLTSEELAKEEGIYNPNATYKPILVIIGENFILPALEDEIKNMKEGEEKEIKLEPEKGFGKRNPKLIKTIPKKAFRGRELSPGIIVDFGEKKARIQSISGGRVRLDFNHPLSGKNLFYKIKVKEKLEDNKKKLKFLLRFFGLGKKYKIYNEKVVIELKIPQDLKQRLKSLVKKYIPNIKDIKFKESEN